MNPCYNRNYTKEQVNGILYKIKNCIKKDHYTIAMNGNRQENIDFINEYYMKSSKQKEVLLQLRTEDFCYTLQNTKPGFEHEVLYVFVPRVRLLHIDGTEEFVDIYIKFNLLEFTSMARIVVVSFHKRNKPVRYLFREDR